MGLQIMARSWKTLGCCNLDFTVSFLAKTFFYFNFLFFSFIFYFFIFLICICYFFVANGLPLPLCREGTFGFPLFIQKLISSLIFCISIFLVNWYINIGWKYWYENVLIFQIAFKAHLFMVRVQVCFISCGKITISLAGR